MIARRASFLLMVAAAPLCARAADNLIRPALPPPPDSTGAGAFDTLRVIGALILVLAAIWICRWIMQRMARGPGGGANAAIRILCRTPVSPRQQILAVQVGPRVLIVADSGQQLSMLCQITDPEEVARLAGTTSVEATPASRAVARATDENPDTAVASIALATDEPPEMRTLLEKVRGLSRQFR